MPHGLGTERDLVSGPRLVPTNDREVRRTRYRTQRETEHRMPIDAQRELRGGFGHARDIRVVPNRVDVADVDAYGVEHPAVQRRRVDEMLQRGTETEDAHDTPDRGRGRHDRGAGRPALSVREHPTEADGARDVVAEGDAAPADRRRGAGASARRSSIQLARAVTPTIAAPIATVLKPSTQLSNWRPVLVSARRAMPIGMKPDATYAARSPPRRPAPMAGDSVSTESRTLAPRDAPIARQRRVISRVGGRVSEDRLPNRERGGESGNEPEGKQPDREHAGRVLDRARVDRLKGRPTVGGHQPLRRRDEGIRAGPIVQMYRDDARPHEVGMRVVERRREERNRDLARPVPQIGTGPQHTRDAYRQSRTTRMREHGIAGRWSVVHSEAALYLLRRERVQHHRVAGVLAELPGVRFREHQLIRARGSAPVPRGAFPASS